MSFICLQYPCWSLNIWPNQAIVLHIILEELRTGGSTDMWVSHSIQLEILLSAYLSEVISLDGVLPHSCLVPVIRCLELSTEASYWGRWAIRRTVMCLRHTTRWCLLPSTSLLQRYSRRSTRLPCTTAATDDLQGGWGSATPLMSELRAPAAGYAFPADAVGPVCCAFNVFHPDA